MSDNNSFDIFRENKSIPFKTERKNWKVKGKKKLFKIHSQEIEKFWKSDKRE